MTKYKHGEMAMAESSKATVFCLDRPFDDVTFKKVLEDAGYTQTALAETLGISCAHERQDLEVVCRRAGTDSPYHVLVRLFWLGRAVPEAALHEALPGLNVEELHAVGLLNHRNGVVQANARLGPYHELLVAGDFEPGIHRNLPPDHVLGVSAASMTLASLTVRRKIKRALDLGTGAGIQAFLTARHADHVTATDTNPRALNFARFNALLNGINDIEWREGNLYEPAADRQFDLIVCNPPFVISPESRFAFRDAGLPGDAVSEQVVRGAGPRLTEGGFASILFNWHHQDDDDLETRPRAWVAGSGCDTLLVCFKSMDSLTYAADWLQTSIGRSTPEYGRCLDEWMAYYHEMGIRRISAGIVIMRRRDTQKNWFRAHSVGTGRCTGSAGRQIERIFAAEDLLQSLDDDRRLLEHRLLFDEHHRLEHQLSVEDGRWVVRAERLCASEGLPFAGNADAYIAKLLAGCDGRRTLRELVAEVGESVKTDSEKLTAGCLTVVRKLMQSGFLSSADNARE
jgi:methylase of polypeptide subunit release factors